MDKIILNRKQREYTIPLVTVGKTSKSYKHEAFQINSIVGPTVNYKHNQNKEIQLSTVKKYKKLH